MRDQSLRLLGTRFAARHARNKALQERLEGTHYATWLAAAVTAAAAVLTALLLLV